MNKLFSRINNLNHKIKLLAEEVPTDQPEELESTQVPPEPKPEVSEPKSAQYLLCYKDLVEIKSSNPVNDIKINGELLGSSLDDKDHKVSMYLVRNVPAFIVEMKDSTKLAYTFKDKLDEF